VAIQKQHLGASNDENTENIQQDDKTFVEFLEQSVSPEADVIEPAEVFPRVRVIWTKQRLPCLRK
jgi:hypothetical protein